VFEAGFWGLAAQSGVPRGQPWYSIAGRRLSFPEFLHFLPLSPIFVALEDERKFRAILRDFHVLKFFV
jgi:hypothetical protein